MSELFGAVEAGGTKFVCAVGDLSGGIIEDVKIPTTSPDETFRGAIGALRQLESKYGKLRGIGVASFGPLELDRASAKWGCIVQTPKMGWSDTSVVEPFTSAFGCPVALDTDVNGAALAEYLWGAAKGDDVAAYVTVGTGIGGGVIVDGQPLHGRRHPEVGHIRPPRHPLDVGFAGTCPFHGDCVEGLASGPAIVRRWQKPLSELPPDHPAHAIIASYLGYLALTLGAALSPRRIIFGGGVAMDTPGLIARIRQAACDLDAGYLLPPSQYDALICLPHLGNKTGVLGAVALAQRQFSSAKSTQ